MLLGVNVSRSGWNCGSGLTGVMMAPTLSFRLLEGRSGSENPTAPEGSEQTVSERLTLMLLLPVDSLNGSLRVGRGLRVDDSQHPTRERSEDLDGGRTIT